jgi:hypothetical protein
MNYVLITISSFLIVTVLLLLTTGFVSLLRTRKQVKHWQQTSGVVVGNENRGSSDGSDMFSPIVCFTAVDNSRIQFTEQSCTHPPRYEIGEQVMVLYDPDNFHEARVFTPFGMYYGAIFRLGMGLVFLMVYVLAIVSYLILSKLPEGP